MADDDLDHKILQSQRDLGEAEAKVARLVGRTEAHFDNLRDDRVYTELLRAKAWLRHDPGLVVTRDPDNPSMPRGVPSGWPEGVDGDETIDADLVARRDAYIETTFGHRKTSGPGPEVTPLVSRFRHMIGDTT